MYYYVFRFDFKENPQFIVKLFVRWRRCAKHVRQVKIFITEFRWEKIYILLHLRERITRSVGGHCNVFIVRRQVL